MSGAEFVREPVQSGIGHLVACDLHVQGKPEFFLPSNEMEKIILTLCLVILRGRRTAREHGTIKPYYVLLSYRSLM